jgi:hypothetical protein
MIEPLLLTATQISTFDRARMLTKASGFFFSREDRLFQVTSRHVVCDEPSEHLPVSAMILAMGLFYGGIARSSPTLRRTMWRRRDPPLQRCADHVGACWPVDLVRREYAGAITS